MKKLTALVLAAGLALSAGTAATAMTDEELIGMGHSMLTGALYNTLQRQGFSTDGLERLTLNEVSLLFTILNSDDYNTTERKAEVAKVMDAVMAR